MERDDDIDHRVAARLCVDASLVEGAPVMLDAGQTHYLRSVMRLGAGAEILLFNGRDGEWRGQISAISKVAANIIPLRQTRTQKPEIDIQLVFAPIKRTRMEILVEKAVELGASALVPVITRRTNVTRLNLERLSAHAREAAEQTGRLSVPPVLAAQSLETVLARWPTSRRLLLCDESGTAPAIAAAFQGSRPCAESWAVLIGPEGGFDPSELDLIRSFHFVTPVSLGPRVLRADTAALAALAVFQALQGDWSAARVGHRSSTTPSAPPQR